MCDSKNYVVDPLTVLCKIALLYFMSEGTRITIGHHVLCLQEYTYYQCLERTINGDKRIDISNLNTPFIKAIKWYIIDCKVNANISLETRNIIHNITNYTIKGLEKMQKTTYHHDICIQIILQYFINMLRHAVEGTFDETQYVIGEIDSLMDDTIKNNIDVNTLSSIAKFLEDAEHETIDNTHILIECAHRLLLNRDTNFVKLMRDVIINH